MALAEYGTRASIMVLEAPGTPSSHASDLAPPPDTMATAMVGEM
jgi:hypothetical protein